MKPRAVDFMARLAERHTDKQCKKRIVHVQDLHDAETGATVLRVDVFVSYEGVASEDTEC